MAALIIVICLLGCAIFSGLEMAFVSADKLQIEIDKKQDRVSSKIIAIFIKNPSRFFIAMRLGIILFLVLYCFMLPTFLNPYLNSVNFHPYLLLSIIIFISGLILIVFAGLFPIVFFLRSANNVLNYFSIPAFALYVLFYPITIILEKYVKSIFITDENSGKQNSWSLINQSKQSEEKDDDSHSNEIKLFQNAIDFNSVRVRDCMVPRTEIAALPEDSVLDDFKKMFIDTGFSKILIYHEKVDNIIGYVTSKSLFANANGKKLPIINLLFVPETMPANRLLKKLIHEKKNVAVVVDEFGGVVGMLTIEDIIEEIFGEIEDEYDTQELIEKRLSPNEYIFSGRLEIDYLNETYELGIPESDEYETLAGFILFYNESIPKQSEKLFIRNFEIKIHKVSNTKVELVYLMVCK